jgi:pyridoxamine 5'-phosphate oxidase family protein
MLTEKDAYVNGQRLGRLATSNARGVLHVCPVSFRWNDQDGTIDIGGMNLPPSLKFRNVQANSNASFVIDDVASIDPWTPRGIEFRGTAETLATGGRDVNPRFGPELIRIRPHRIRAWGIEGGSYEANSRRVPRQT